ncbi:MAG: PAS domain S-box protein [Spirochaetes bacterium]|nr:PAS domain S-box protein [Spirochaetota bacterium]
MERESREELISQIRALQKRVKELEQKLQDAIEGKEVARDEWNFYSLVNYLPDIIYYIDEDGRFKFVSDYVRVLGYLPEELIGKHFSTIIHPDDVPQVSRSHVLPKFKGKITGVERSPSLFDERRRYGRIRRGADIRLLSKAHSADAHGYVYVDAEVNAAGTYAVQNGKEVFTGTIGVIRDITFKKKLTQKKVSISEQRYQTLLEKTKDAIVHVDGEGNVLFANSAFFELFGTSVDEATNFVQFAKNNLCEKSQRDFEEFWEGFSTSKVLSESANELSWRVGNGEIRHTENIASILQNSDENFECLQLIIRDITHKKIVENALRESEELFRNLIESMPLMISVVSDQKVMYVNKNFEKTLGYHRNELVGTNFDYYTIFVPDFREMVQKTHARVALNESAKEFECIVHARDGRCLTVVCFPRCIAFRGKNVILDTFIDITERKALEERTLKSQKLESLSILAGGIAHDFNNILTVIMGNITLSRINPSDPEVIVQNLTAAEEAVNRARELTRQFLAFSRNTAPVKKLMPLDGIIKDATMFASSGSSIKVDLLISDDLWYAEIDDGQIGQALHTLIMRGIQVSPPNGTVVVRASNKVIGEGTVLPISPGNYVKILVKDFGMVISPENLSRVFDPYFTTGEASTSLGLAIAYSIITKHGGHIEVESSVDSGTTFTVYLPAVHDAHRASFEVVHAVRETKPRVLLMDDDEAVIEIVTKFLSYLGYEFETARDGQEAITKFVQGRDELKPFDVVILDLAVTGGMGGRETLAVLKKIDPQVRAVLATGYLNDPVVLNYQDYGFADLIKKPFRLEELNRILHRVLS